MRALLIVNPNATSTTPAARDLLAHALSSRVRVTVAQTTHRDHAAELAREAREDGVGLVIVHGGDGTVNEVALTTIGQLAEPGQPLLTIVPAGNDLYVHTFLLDLDRGFVSVGDEGVIKLEAYPFTRHGFLRGEVDVISSDSVVDEARGLVYPARVRIVGNDVRANGRAAPLTAGMAATVEVTTGRRRVIDYVLSPVARATSEAGRER